AKIAINTFVCAKISQANILAGLCERIPGADVDIVTQAVGSDSRVGRKAFTGGLGYGGPCYPKDVRSFAALLEGMGLPASFFEAVHAGNESAGAHLADCVLQLADELHAGAVGLFGVAFKPGSSSVANSSGVALAKRLLGQSRRVILHDPLALDAAREIFGGRLRYVRDVRECFDACGVAVFVNADPCYRALTRDWFESHPGPLAVVDCWRMYRFLENAKSIRYRPIGLYQAPRETPAELENRKVHSQ
ncbi:MAG TPA: UDP binding domain-containing protein, partial [Chthoniobacteraceae bacterium]|nr:UDP binding domain-containing protein [Chthoniobacteraceae bacterium]